MPSLQDTHRERAAALALFFTPGVGCVTYRRLMERFGSPANVFRASDTQLLAIKGIGPDQLARIRRSRRNPRVSAEIERAELLGIHLVCFHEKGYPEQLREIYDPPPILYVKGSIRAEDRYAVAVVGTRTPTRYGIEMAGKIARGLAERGVTVVSGLARGIDAAAHRSVLSEGGRTFGVLGCGMDVVYPPEHGPLYEAVQEQGALVSEFPLGTGPAASNFPKRNRIISGLCLGTVVVEAADRSGSLITARMALEQNRQVFAVPGSSRSPFSRGTHRLIRQGAVLVEDARDICEELRELSDLAGGRGEDRPAPSSVRPVGTSIGTVDPMERQVLDRLGEEPVHVDELLRSTALSPGELSNVLLSLELKNLIRQLPGNVYVRNA